MVRCLKNYFETILAPYSSSNNTSQRCWINGKYPCRNIIWVPLDAGRFLDSITKQEEVPSRYKPATL